MAFTLNAKKNTRTTAAAASTRDEDEYAGLWINVGIVTNGEEGTESDGETHFNRLPRGIAVSDLVDHKVYASTNPAWAEEATLVNALMSKIREHGLALEEGEAVPLQFSVQLYKRQEQVDQAATPAADAPELDSLFG